MKLKTYKMGISPNEKDGTEVDFVGLVDRPAIERDFLVFKEKKMLFIEDEEQRIVTGPAMVPDVPIFRKDKEYGEHFVLFEADTIAELALRFFKKGYQKNINFDHERKDLVKDSVFFESWIVDREKGKQPLKGFEDMPDGTWFLTAKVEDDEAWEKIKSGEVRGFSVEGLFQYREVGQTAEEEFMAEIVAILREAGEDL